MQLTTAEIILLLFSFYGILTVMSVVTNKDVLFCDFEDPRSPMCSFRIKFPQRSLDHREEQWDVRLAGETRSPGGSDGPVADRTLDNAQGSYAYTTALNQTGRYFYSFRVIIVSPSLVLTSGQGRLSFSTYLWTYLHPVSKSDNLPTIRVRGCDDQISWSLQGRTAAWQHVDIPITCNKTFQLVFEAIHRMPGSGVAVDDVRIISVNDLKGPQVGGPATVPPTEEPETMETTELTTDEEGSVNRSLVISLSGPTIGAVVGIILVIVFVNVVIYLFLRMKMKQNNRKRSTTRRNNQRRNPSESFNDKTQGQKIFSLGNDNYSVPNEGIYADSFDDDTWDSFVESLPTDETVSTSSKAFAGYSSARSSMKSDSTLTYSNGKYSRSQKASLIEKPKGMPRRGVERKDSPGFALPTLMAGLRKEPIMPKIPLPLQHRKESSGSLNHQLLTSEEKNGIKTGLWESDPMAIPRMKKNSMLRPELPLPMHRRSEASIHIPDIPVMLVTGRRKESAPINMPQDSNKEYSTTYDSTIPQDVGKQRTPPSRENRSPKANRTRNESVTSDNSSITITGKIKERLSPKSSPKERLSPKSSPKITVNGSPTPLKKPLPNIPNSFNPQILITNDSPSSTDYTEVSVFYNKVDADNIATQMNRSNAPLLDNTDNIFRDKLLSVRYDETGYLKPSCPDLLPSYESADEVKRNTRRLCHEYHDMEIPHSRLHECESLASNGTSFSNRGHTSSESELSSDYEELHIR